ncbi:Bug family tripartite tricarboxylate transporter substrate binding protein [Diaphorobacter sp.]|uniref:Bug family tripartite tricarboxylate transporter substrate binding protein n=1 Tax=Diaphorobacter sp. TaxID=1934310 RepID=UPI003917D9E3
MQTTKKTRHRPMVNTARAAAVLMAGAALAHSASANDESGYPNKPVRLVVGFAAGGPTDVIARAFAEYAGRKLGQSFIVDNKPGANTILAAQAVSSAPADGYTLLFGAVNHSMIPALYSARVKFDAVQSFRPICSVASSPTALVVGPAMKERSVEGFLSVARAKPGSITVGSPGVGSSGHFAMEMFIHANGARLNHIPYKGASQAVTDLMGGQLDASFATLGSVLPQLRAKQLTALAVASPKRSTLLPDVPTLSEKGAGRFTVDAWYGVLAPAKVPSAIAQTLETVAREFGADAATQSRMREMGMDSVSVCGEPFARQLQNESQTYTRIARELRISAD